MKDHTEDEADKYAKLWLEVTQAAVDATEHYFTLIAAGATPDIARAVLPNCLKTEIVVTMNIRELRTFFRLRTSAAAHHDISKLAKELYHLLVENGLGILFEDLEIPD